MKAGDIIEWKGKNGLIRGRVILTKTLIDQQDGIEEFICRMDNGKVFPLNDLLLSKSARIIEV